MTAEEAAELKRLRAERDHYRALAERNERFWRQAGEDRDAAHEKMTELNEQLEHERDLADRAWETAEFWMEYSEATKAELAEERKERDTLVNHLTGQTPKRRGPPPGWSPDAEAKVERMHRDGASIRQLAADLNTSKTRVHRVIARVRQRQAEAAERARLAAVADGRSPAQLAAGGAKRAAERHPIEDYDPVRAERGAEYLRSRRAEAETNERPA